MPYIDGFVIPVRTADRDIYRDHEAKWWPFFQKLGALSIMVGWGDDVPAGKQTDFRRAVDLADDETVVLCWMTWPDKDTRNAAFQAMMDRSKENPDEFMQMPFDGKRMIFGGFTPIFSAGETE